MRSTADHPRCRPRRREPGPRPPAAGVETSTGGDDDGGDYPSGTVEMYVGAGRRRVQPT